MKKNDLKKILSNLENKQSQLEKRLQTLHVEKSRIENPLSPSNEDDNSQIFSADLLIDILDAKDYKEYNLVKTALKKIKHGEYGECEECGSQISLNRLLALPFARYCIDCAEFIELQKKKKI